MILWFVSLKPSFIVTNPEHLFIGLSKRLSHRLAFHPLFLPIAM